MVETKATGRPFPGWDKVSDNIIPEIDKIYNLGSDSKKWAAIYVALAFITSLTIGGVVKLTTQEGLLFVNASTKINESLWVEENITAVNITATGYFFGDGSKLTGLNLTESDPIFTAWDNFTGIPHATPSDGDTTHFSWADEIYDWVIGLGYLSTETDPLWTGNSTNVAFKNAVNTFTANQNLANQNITAINCIIFDSGGKICSGV